MKPIAMTLASMMIFLLIPNTSGGELCDTTNGALCEGRDPVCDATMGDVCTAQAICQGTGGQVCVGVPYAPDPNGLFGCGGAGVHACVPVEEVLQGASEVFAPGLTIPSPGDRLELGADFALVVYEPTSGQALVTSIARPDKNFDVLVVGVQGIVGHVDIVTPTGTRSMAIDNQDAVLFPDFSPIEGLVYEVRVYDGSNALKAGTGQVALVGVDPLLAGTLEGIMADPTQSSGSYCESGATSGHQNTWHGGSWDQTGGYSTAAISLSKDEGAGDWQYAAQWYTGGGTQTTQVNSAYRYGHGWYGANSYRYGSSYSIGAGEGIRGSQSYQQVNTGGCGYVTVGHIFTLSTPQVFYENVNGVIANHEAAWQMGRPSTSCTSTLPTVLKSALELTRNWGWLGVVIPDKFCTESWSVISSANGKGGLGIQDGRASTGTYEGADSFIQTHYSSTGYFNLEFGGYVKLNGFMNSCQSCAPHKVSYWTGFDNQVWSVGNVYA